jgi:hypothetical protein
MVAKRAVGVGNGKNIIAIRNLCAAVKSPQ